MTGLQNGLPDAAEVAARLADAGIEALVQRLLPAARRESHTLAVGSVAGEVGQSLRIFLAGDGRGTWKDFAGDDKHHGDLLDLIAWVLFGGDKKLAYRWALEWLGIQRAGEQVHRAVRRAELSDTERAQKQAEDAEAKRKKALGLFLSAQPSIAGTPAEAYLLGRGIDLRPLGRQPGALRYHPACWCSERAGPRPALVLAVSKPTVGHVATHRIYLDEVADPETGELVWRKDPLLGRNAKKIYGFYTGGSIQIWRPDNVRLRDAPEGAHVVITEGPENALVAALARPDRYVISAVNASNIKNLALPVAVATVTIVEDNDMHDDVQKYYDAATERFRREGRRVLRARPTEVKDLNDLTDPAARRRVVA